jgi:hypothetical protein
VGLYDELIAVPGPWDCFAEAFGTTGVSVRHADNSVTSITAVIDFNADKRDEGDSEYIEHSATVMIRNTSALGAADVGMKDKGTALTFADSNGDSRTWYISHATLAAGIWTLQVFWREPYLKGVKRVGGAA